MSASNRCDGRTARRERNRESALDGYIELLAEGIVDPTFEQIADRSGLSYRSIYRYFDGLDEIKGLATERTMDWLGPLIERSLGRSGTPELLCERIDHVIDSRLQMYDATAPTIRMALANSGSNAEFARQIDATRRALRCRVAEIFAPELAHLDDSSRELCVSSIAQSLSFNALEFHLTQSGHEPADVHRLLRVQVSAALPTPPTDG